MPFTRPQTMLQGRADFPAPTGRCWLFLYRAQRRTVRPGWLTADARHRLAHQRWDGSQGPRRRRAPDSLKRNFVKQQTSRGGRKPYWRGAFWPKDNTPSATSFTAIWNEVLGQRHANARWGEGREPSPREQQC